ncbi:MAG: hypothetical protein PGN16_14130 [Sphingomonas phyllosphaerae]|uniref:hypothetical protein n=1 Tax=Sphingomonas phyllosphaerae TaxID=257003 RepID=UPI002FFB75E8
MRFDRTEQFAASGVPLVFDRFGLIGPFVADVVDPSSAARGVLVGLTMATLLWMVIAVLVI